MIASRRSALARVQAEAVGRALGQRHGVEVRYHWVQSEGDRVTDRPLASLGGKGLFTRALDRALLNNEADIAVHSLKDVPTSLPAGLRLAATPKRGPVEDVLITAGRQDEVAALPNGAVLGTSSARRAAQLRRLNPSLRIALLRGNLDTRLAAVLDATPTHHATLLAAAGLQRLKGREPVGVAIPVEQVLPAVAQGALALVCRGDDHVTLTRCLPLNCPATNTAATAERQLAQALGCDCHSPIAALVEPVDPALTKAERNADSHYFRLRARVVSIDGKRCAEFDEQCKTRELRRLIGRAAEALKSHGADAILADARQAELFDAEPLSASSGTKAPTVRRVSYAE